jgi:glycine oxidase
MRTYDVAVVGAGIAGAAVAWGCARRGARVVVLEREAPAAGASGAAAGMLAPCSEATTPGPFLALARHSLRLWPAVAAELLEETGIDCELDTGGLLRVALDEADTPALRERIAWQRAAGATVEWLDGAALAGVEPALAGAAGAALHAGEGHVHSVRAVTALLTAARRHGAEVESGAEVVGGLDGGGVRLAGGTRVAAGAVVVCAGAWTGALTATLGGPALPVEPVRGQLLGLRGLVPRPTRVLYAGLEGYAVAKRDGLTLVGATEEHAGFDTRPTEAAAERLRGVGARLLRGFPSATVAHTWVGLRPHAPDGLPLLGRLGDAAGGGSLHTATGHYRNGVLLAPATAEGMASVLLDGVTPAGWEAFDPRRRMPPAGGG